MEEKSQSEKDKYREELINILDNLKKMGLNINYDTNMSTEELELIVNSVKA
jgi:hypothetical protein